MLSLDQLEEELEIIQEDPVEYFGKHSKPKQRVKELQIQSHPDRWPNDTERAHAIFAAIGVAFETQISEHVGEYRLTRQIARGDLSNIWGAKRNGEAFVVKRPRVKAKPLVRREAESLKLLSKQNVFSGLVPKYVETIGDCNVLQFPPGVESLHAIGKRYPEGIDGRHVAWIFKRLMMVIGFAHQHGIVHGAINPEHVLVTKANHGVCLTGWVHSGKEGDAIKVVPANWKDLYPSWTRETKKLSQAMDIAMTAQVLFNQVNDQCPRRIATFLRGCMTQAVVNHASAWDLHEDFDAVLRRVYGKPKFVTLE